MPGFVRSRLPAMFRTSIRLLAMNSRISALVGSILHGLLYCRHNRTVSSEPGEFTLPKISVPSDNNTLAFVRTGYPDDLVSTNPNSANVMSGPLSVRHPFGQ